MNPEYSELIYMLRKCRAVLNMAGYYDMVVAIDKMLGEESPF